MVGSIACAERSPGSPAAAYGDAGPDSGARPAIGEEIDLAQVLAGHRLADAAAPSAPLRWSSPPPGCALEYSVRTDGTTAHDAPPFPGGTSGVRAVIDFGLKGDEGTTTLTLDGVRMGFIGPTGATGVRAGDLGLDPILLTTDGRSWTATRDPQNMWRVGPRGAAGPAHVFPSLPATPGVGASVDWTMPGGDGTGAPNRPVSVALRRWISIDGELAAELVAEWSEPGRTVLPDMIGLGGPTQIEVEQRSRARWLVLAGGRLLWASIRTAAVTRASSPAPMGTQRSTTTVDSEARLVSGCGGLALGPFPLTPTERATDAWTAMTESLLAGDDDGALRWFAPPLRQDARALTALVRRFGPPILGVPILNPELEARGTLVHMLLYASREGRSDLPAEVEVSIDVGGPTAQIRDVRIAATLPQPEQLFYLAPFSRQSVADGWNPAAPSDAALTTETSFLAPEDDWLLVRRGEQRCAFRFRTSNAAGLAGYEWASWRGPGSSPRRGTATVAESSDSSGDASTGPVVASTFVRCGEIEIEWSAPRYVYLAPSFDLAPTDTRALEELDPLSPRLWLSRRWGQLAYDAGAESRAWSSARGRGP